LRAGTATGDAARQLQIDTPKAGSPMTTIHHAHGAGRPAFIAVT
jgi:hypothetical protein